MNSPRVPQHHTEGAASFLQISAEFWNSENTGVLNVYPLSRESYRKSSLLLILVDSGSHTAQDWLEKFHLRDGLCFVLRPVDENGTWSRRHRDVNSDSEVRGAGAAADG